MSKPRGFRPTELRFALPLITRPTEHSGVTFGAATSVLLTGVEMFYLQRHYKKEVRSGRNCRNPDEGIDKSGIVPQGVSTYGTLQPCEKLHVFSRTLTGSDNASIIFIKWEGVICQDHLTLQETETVLQRRP
jgi:hypothetical protein